jgi:hypothetical protein
MKHLIKPTSHFFGEIIHPKKVFPNSLNCFIHTNDLTHFRSLMEFPIPFRSQQKSYFCWLFFASYTLKNQYIR